MEKVKSLLKGNSSDDTTKHSSSTTSTRGMDDTTTTSGTAGTTGTSSNTGVDSDYSSSRAGTTSGTSGKDSSHRSGNTTEFETVDQRVNPAVSNETYSRVHEDQQQKVVDRERHQDHYHTTVQPVTDNQVLPTQHSKQTAETQYKDYEHDDPSKVKAKLEAEAAQFQNTRTEGATQATQSKLDTIGTESVHHHLHETTQPIINREIVQPSVTKTTVPIHETHHEASQMHGTTIQPEITMDEFNRTRSGVQGSETTDRSL